MIRLTRLSGSTFVLNSDLIERIDRTPDTVITLGDGTKYVAAEDLDTVVSAIRLHRAEVIALAEQVQFHIPDVSDRHQLASVTDLSPQERHREGGLS
jgi:flagellar protein FlbD